jgi:uncharacterized protein (TIGR02270 family)
VLPVIAQHVEDAAILWQTRSFLTRSPHVELLRLRRLDDRLAAHLDGIALAGAEGRRLCMMSLEQPAAGSIFVATVLAIESRDSAWLNDLFALVPRLPEVRPGLLSAFGWVSAPLLQSTVKALLASQSSFRRHAGIAACAMHAVDPGPALVEALRDSDAELRARALRTAGVLGKVDLLDVVVKGINDPASDCRFWSAWSAVLLGRRAAPLDALLAMANQPGSLAGRALGLALRAADLTVGNEFLRAMAREPAQTRRVIEGAGVVGDPYYVPWLVQQMDDLKLCRAAGEAFTMITGADLALGDLERKPPDDLAAGPNEDAADDDVSMDPDDGLPWPDPERIRRWWSAEGARFAAATRYFMGETLSRANGLRVLREGAQRQRAAAAEHLCLLQPGTPLFNTSAPAWRQQRWLSKLQ